LRLARLIRDQRSGNELTTETRRHGDERERGWGIGNRKWEMGRGANTDEAERRMSGQGKA
jgi:hypothetical protein